MVLSPHVPHDFPALPKNILESYFIDDDLAPQRKEALKILKGLNKFFANYYKNQKHNDISPDRIEQALYQTELSLMRKERNENPEWIKESIDKAVKGFKMNAVAVWPDERKLLAVIKALRDHKDIAITLPLNSYPHPYYLAGHSQAVIERWALFFEKHDVENPINIKSVIPTASILHGDFKAAESVMKAERKFTAQHNMKWQSVQMVSLQAKIEDFFQAVYKNTYMALDYGADVVQTATGFAAKPPYNDFVKKDTGPPIKILPLLMAVRDYNKEHNTYKVPLFGGALKNEADAVALLMACDAVLGDDLSFDVGFEGGLNFRKRLLQYLHARPDYSFDAAFDIEAELGHDAEQDAQIPQAMTGLPDSSSNHFAL